MNIMLKQAIRFAKKTEERTGIKQFVFHCPVVGGHAWVVGTKIPESGIYYDTDGTDYGFAGDPGAHVRHLLSK